MKRSELTVSIMNDRGFRPVDSSELDIKDIVFNIRNNEYWKYLRLTTDSGVYTETEYNMCSTYEVYLRKEYLEVSEDKKTWYKVAFRFVEFNRRCLYAD